jgi:cation:H+ antiporter
MTEGVVAILGLAAGVLIAFAGGEALTRAARALLGAAGGLAGFAAVAASAVPEYAFAMRASALNLPGAAIGAVAGSLTANAFIAAVIASNGPEQPARGARTLAIATALAAVALIGAAYDGEISQAEGGAMLVAALVCAWLSARGAEPSDQSMHVAAPLPGLGFGLLGAVLIAGGSWLALNGVATLGHGRADGDLVAGLCALGLGAAAPEILAAALAAKRGEGGQALANVAAGASLVLFGALGAAALVRPLTITEAFLGAPALAVGLSALLILGLSVTRVRVSRLIVPLGAAVYVGFFVAFLGAA